MIEYITHKHLMKILKPVGTYNFMQYCSDMYFKLSIDCQDNGTDSYELCGSLTKDNNPRTLYLK